MKLVEETPVLKKYKFYIIDNREIEGYMFARTAQEARSQVAEKYKINPEEVDIDIFEASEVGYK